jgi:hypothetical protein
MQGPNLSQVPLGFLNVVPDGVQLLPDRNLASISQRGFEALKAKCGKSGEGISLLYSLAGRHGSILEFGFERVCPSSRHPPAQVAEALPFLSC